MNRNERSRQGAWHRGVRAIALMMVVSVLAACSTAPKPQGQLIERAQARWDAIIARDYDAAYALYSPGYRSATSRTDFEIELRSRRISWTSASYRAHSCDGQVCSVTFDIEFTAPRPVPGMSKWDGRSSVEDSWIEVSGQWWYVPPEQ
jgi:hypothetical protein